MADQSLRGSTRAQQIAEILKGIDIVPKAASAGGMTVGAHPQEDEIRDHLRMLLDINPNYRPGPRELATFPGTTIEDIDRIYSTLRQPQ
jgi:hypothetical protein